MECVAFSPSEFGEILRAVILVSLVGHFVVALFLVPLFQCALDWSSEK